jgi:ABC-type branched-subunit amino acid transport system substrate-binding protein
VQAYDAALLIKKGVESGTVRDRASLREFLLSLKEHPSAEGPLTTDENGDILQRPLLLTVVDGEIVPFEIEFD